MRIEIDKEEYKDLIETKEEFLKTVRKLDNITIENIKLTDKLKEKEQECEELKEAIDSLLKIQYQLADSCTKYEQTLTEIKDIAEGMNEECFYDDFDCMNCDMQYGCTYFNKKQILQKISEVENDR